MRSEVTKLFVASAEGEPMGAQGAGFLAQALASNAALRELWSRRLQFVCKFGGPAAAHLKCWLFNFGCTPVFKVVPGPL